MAIFHLTHGFVRRSKGASSLAAAAYISGQKLEDSKGSSKRSDYRDKGDVLFEEICLPKGTPAWANDRGELWRRVEAREDRSTRPRDAVLAHNFNIALPHELTLEQNIFLARDFVREQFTRKGYAADWAIHSPDPRGDSRNIHLHILVPLRKIEGESFGNKVNYSKSQLREQTKAWRRSWALLANRHLKRYGHKAQIDERSLRAQGIKRKPVPYKGPQPRAKCEVLDALRSKLPPQPQRPIVRIAKQAGSDGSVTVRARISRTALSNIDSGHSANNHEKDARRSLSLSNNGWPPEAIEDWKNWGHLESFRFFIKWPLLGTATVSSSETLHP